MQIDEGTYWKAYGLFVAASHKQREVDMLESQMNKLLLCADNGSHASDAIYDRDYWGEREAFDTAIKHMGLTVEGTTTAPGD